MRIAVLTHDDELRVWIVEELLLLSWPSPVQIDACASIDDLRAEAAALVIVGIDGLSHEAAQRLRERTWSAPLVGVGARTREHGDLGFAYELDARLTSRELKYVVRQLLAKTPPTARAAAVRS